MIKKNKKGMSTIVITLLIVVLSLVAIGGIWAVVQNVLNTNSKQIQTGTITANLDVINAYEELGTVRVKVTREAGAGEITKIKFILSDGGDQEVITEEVEGFDEYETLDFILTPTKLISGTILTISVVAVVKSGDTEVVSGITDVQTLVNLYNQNGGENGGDEEGEEEQGCTPDCGARLCGPAPNECNGADACGTCSTGTCSPLGACQYCQPLASCTEGKICGTQSNNCGGTLTCGTCPSGKICSSDQKIVQEKNVEMMDAVEVVELVQVYVKQMVLVVFL
jgi:hypothetical protein